MVKSSVPVQMGVKTRVAETRMDVAGPTGVEGYAVKLRSSAQPDKRGR
jgi:hypothetical protein